MSEVVIRQLLETALQAMTPALATAPENVVYTPVGGTPYQQVAFLWAEPENPVVTAGFHREVFIFQVTLAYPLGTGPGDAAARAELIRAAFPRGKTFTSGQITVTVQRTPAVTPGRVDGDRWSVPVKIRCFANVFE